MQKLHPKYLASWKIFLSPFDKGRTASETDATAPVSYGFNANAKDSTGGDSLLSDKIANPSTFILFAPTAEIWSRRCFRWNGRRSVTVLKNTSSPGGSAAGGTHNKRLRINACLADLHVDNMAWGTSGASGFVNDQSTHVRHKRQPTLESNCHPSSGGTVIAVRVRNRENDYHALVGSGLLHDAGANSAKSFAANDARSLSDTNVGALFGQQLVESLTSARFQPTLITVPAGEEAKSLEQAGAICDEMIAAGLDRQSFVIGLGGGVVGDLSGFVASIFERGIPHVLIPTTLLAMVDSSIGGKTGVNTRDGKNLIGAFHHPVLIIDDVDLLKTLPPREFSQGFAEIIKHAVIADAEMFADLVKFDADKLDGLKPSSLMEALVSLIQRNIEIKANIVAKDECDRTGERAPF